MEHCHTDFHLAYYLKEQKKRPGKLHIKKLRYNKISQYFISFFLTISDLWHNTGSHPKIQEIHETSHMWIYEYKWNNELKNVYAK